MLASDKSIEILVKVDDFCKGFETEIAKHRLDAGNYKVRFLKLSDYILDLIILPFLDKMKL